MGFLVGAQNLVRDGVCLIGAQIVGWQLGRLQNPAVAWIDQNQPMFAAGGQQLAVGAECDDLRARFWQLHLNPRWRKNLIYRNGNSFSGRTAFANGEDRLFFGKVATGQNNRTQAGRQFKKLAENTLDDGFLASPAVAGKALFLRTRSHLYRIEN